MSSAALATILADLEDELFYAVLDVALDIDQALTVQAAQAPVHIDAIRNAIRFPILLPANTAQLQFRYKELREKGLALLQKQSVIGSKNWTGSGSSWLGGWNIAVTDRAQFAKLLTGLKADHERRNPAQKPATDNDSAIVRLLQLAESFHRVAMGLRDRRTGREPVIIKDEYDVHYVFAALLASQFADVRPGGMDTDSRWCGCESGFLPERRIHVR